MTREDHHVCDRVRISKEVAVDYIKALVSIYCGLSRAIERCCLSSIKIYSFQSEGDFEGWIGTELAVVTYFNMLHHICLEIEKSTENPRSRGRESSPGPPENEAGC